MSRFLIGVILIVSNSVRAQAHELPDGAIERRVQVTVKPDRVLIEYSFTMSNATLKTELRKHKQKPAETLSANWKQYQTIILPLLQQHLHVTVDGKRSAVESIRANYTGWSHGHLTCLFKANCQLNDKAVPIAVTDGNFPDAPGAYRLAMKSRSGATMRESNVPTLITQAKPVAFERLNKQQKQSATRAVGVFSRKQ